MTQVVNKYGISYTWQLVIAGVIMIPITISILSFICHSIGFCKRGMSCCGAEDEVEDSAMVIEDDTFDDDAYRRAEPAEV
eukprot:CAMPEP_0116875970 /NCGR_PEP_ID=MMETSP0463-20121206/8050_1 /TAXON_ID=181622 /ORGANISM="Strombidinopsis sp, Strain SopsisLIS2011" /LENGTH=79 /DNA_ID=CAMNT_0004522383 /DNA_START=558 /DNA_END=797 /DNA_ORIENTATION=+